ncbi:MAG: Ger(x)C family spore germination protein [Clostridiaceae bacterium]
MNRKLILLCILMSFIIFFAGCWSATELNSLSIVTAVGIDKSESGYLVTIQLMNPSEVRGIKTSIRVPVITYQITGQNVFEAFRRLKKQTPRKVYIGHLNVIVLGEELAKDGIDKILDFFFREHEIRTDFAIIIAKNIEAEKVLNILTPLEKIPVNKIHNSLETSQDLWGSTYDVHIDELINDLISEGKNPVVTGIEVIGNSKIGSSISNVENVKIPTIVTISNIGVFQKDKLIGWLSENEGIGYNYIMGKIKSTIVTLPCEDGNIGIELLKIKSKIKGKVENGKPKIEVKLWVEGNVADVGCKVELSKSKNIYELEEKLQKKIKIDMEKTVEKVQKDFKSDIFGFGDAIHRADSKAWKELKNNWNTTGFVDLPVDIQVTAKISGVGTVVDSFLKE